MSRSLMLAWLAMLAAVAGCGQEPRNVAPGKATPTAVVKPPVSGSLVGRVFQANYSGAWCNRMPADPAKSVAATTPDPLMAPETEAETEAREANALAARIVAEAPAVASTAGRVSRHGPVLTVSGARFADDRREGDTSVVYTYAGRLRTAPFDVVHGVHWEWLSWSLIDARGVKVALSGPPVASPNGRAFAATGDDMEGESFNGVEIADYSGATFSSVEIEAQAACNPRWIDNDTLEIKVLPQPERFARAPDAARPSDWKTALIVRDGKTWKRKP